MCVRYQSSELASGMVVALTNRTLGMLRNLRVDTGGLRLAQVLQDGMGPRSQRQNFICARREHGKLDPGRSIRNLVSCGQILFDPPCVCNFVSRIRISSPNRVDSPRTRLWVRP